MRKASLPHHNERRCHCASRLSFLQGWLKGDVLIDIFFQTNLWYCISHAETIFKLPSCTQRTEAYVWRLCTFYTFCTTNGAQPNGMRASCQEAVAIARHWPSSLEHPVSAQMFLLRNSCSNLAELLTQPLSAKIHWSTWGEAPYNQIFLPYSFSLRWVSPARNNR